MQSLISSLLALCAMLGWGQPANITGISQTQPNIRHHIRPGAPKLTPALTPTPTPAPSGPPVLTPTPPSASPPLSATPVTAAPAEIASEQTCPGQTSVANTAAALTCLTNNARVFHGLKPVPDNAALMSAAAAKDQSMAKCGYGHTACGQAFDAQIKAAGYTGKCYGENIAMGQQTPHDVFVAWMNSPGHRANILNSQYSGLGVAETAVSGGPLWAMELGGC